MKLNRTLALAMSALGLIAAVWAGLMVTDGRYARAQDVKDQFQQVNEQLQQSRLDGLYRDLGECDRIKGKLRPGEEESILCQRVRKQIEKLDPKR